MAPPANFQRRAGLDQQERLSKTVAQKKQAYHRVAWQSTVGNDRKAHKRTHSGHHTKITEDKNHSHVVGPNVHADRPSHPQNQKIIMYNNIQHHPSTQSVEYAPQLPMPRTTATPPCTSNSPSVVPPPSGAAWPQAGHRRETWFPKKSSYKIFHGAFINTSVRINDDINTT